MYKINKILDVIFHIIQIHERKIMYLGIAIFCITNVNMVHGCLFLCAVFGITTPYRVLRIAFLDICYVLICLLILWKMLFITSIFKSSESYFSCKPGETHYYFDFPANADWYGFNANKLEGFEGYFAIIATSLLFKAASIQYRMSTGIRRMSPKEVLYPEITRKDADQSISTAFQYLVNYGFYKFGLEICQLVLASLVIFKENVYSLVYGVCLLLTLIMSRKVLSKFWGLLCFFVTILVILQYTMMVGVFPGLCSHFKIDLPYLTKIWLFLPDSTLELYSASLIGDVILLMLLRQQNLVFKVEKSPNIPSGSNNSEYKNYSTKNYSNFTPDHTTVYKKTGLDRLKSIVFESIPWVCLSTCFIIGIHADIFALGYLIAAFIISSKGTDTYLLHMHTFISRWIWFLCYMSFSITYKCVVQPLNCHTLDAGHGIPWTIATLTGTQCENGNEKRSQKTLMWEYFQFCIAIFLLRYYKSHYFLHHINDIRAKRVVESGGAILIHKLCQDKSVAERDERVKTLEKIKEDMAQIKAYNQRSQGPTAFEPMTHDQAVMQGDYYMFENKDEVQTMIERSQQQTARKKDRGEKSCETSRRGSAIALVNEETESDGISRVSTMHDEWLQNQPDPDWKRTQQDIHQACAKVSASRFQMVWVVVKDSIGSLMAEATTWLNKVSENERFLVWALKMERISLKERGYLDMEGVFSIRIPTLEEFQKAEEEAEKESSGALWLLFDAVRFVLIANTELLCYLAVFLHQLLFPSLLSLIQPLFILLWGALTTDRPTPTFWIVLISFNMATLTVKTLFQIPIFPWSWTEKPHDMFYPPYIIGLNSEYPRDYFDIYVLIILLMHKEKLKSFGLWTNERSARRKISDSSINFVSDERPSFMDSVKEHVKSMKRFVLLYSEEHLRLPKDVYVFSFLLEFMIFMVILVGFSSFTTNSDDAKLYFAENEVPPLYLVALLIQFTVIIIDRVLYLRKNLIGKFFFHCVLVLLSHLWLFAILPVMTNRPFKTLFWPQVWYTLKYFSFILSAYQLRVGYPLRVQQNFLCKRFTLLNYVLFKGLNILPFFGTIRNMITWISVKTTLTFGEFQLLDTMYSVIFEAKCLRDTAENDPSPRGEPYAAFYKWLNGVAILGGMCVTIWSPLILFAIINRFALSTTPTDAEFSMRIKSITEFFTYHIDLDSIRQFTPAEYDALRVSARGRDEINFLQHYEAQDVVNIQMSTPSMTSWDISPSNFNKLKYALEENVNLILEIMWEIRSETKLEFSTRTTYEEKLKFSTKQQLLQALNEGKGIVNMQMPKHFVIDKEDQTKAIIFNGTGLKDFTLMELHLKSEGRPNENKLWWEATGQCEEPYYTNSDCKKISTVVFTQRKLPAFYAYFTAKGILGLYAVLIAVLWASIRRLIYGLYHDAKYGNLPNADAVYQLCQDIHFARENHEFALEEDLYAKLLFLFRSPETMIKWTRFREHQITRGPTQLAL